MKLKRRVSQLKAGRFGRIAIRELSRSLGGLGRRVTVVHIRHPARYAHENVRHLRTHELLIVTSGRAVADVGGRRVRLSRGDVLYIPPRTWHRFSTASVALEGVSLFWPPFPASAPDLQRRP